MIILRVSWKPRVRRSASQLLSPFGSQLLRLPVDTLSGFGIVMDLADVSKEADSLWNSLRLPAAGFPLLYKFETPGHSAGGQCLFLRLHHPIWWCPFSRNHWSNSIFSDRGIWHSCYSSIREELYPFHLLLHRSSRSWPPKLLLVTRKVPIPSWQLKESCILLSCLV